MKQLTDWTSLTFYFVFIWLTLFIALYVCEFSYEILAGTYWIGAGVIAVFAIVNSTILFVSKRKWKMPDKNSFYNPFSKNVELHLGSYRRIGVSIVSWTPLS